MSRRFGMIANNGSTTPRTNRTSWVFIYFFYDEGVHYGEHRGPREVGSIDTNWTDHCAVQRPILSCRLCICPKNEHLLQRLQWFSVIERFPLGMQVIASCNFLSKPLLLSFLQLFRACCSPCRTSRLRLDTTGSVLALFGQRCLFYSTRFSCLCSKPYAWQKTTAAYLFMLWRPIPIHLYEDRGIPTEY